MEEVLARMGVEEKASALDRLVRYLSHFYDTCEHIWPGIEDVIRDGFDIDDEMSDDENPEDEMSDDENPEDEMRATRDFLGIRGPDDIKMLNNFMAGKRARESSKPPQSIYTIFPDINKFR